MTTTTKIQGRSRALSHQNFNVKNSDGEVLFTVPSFADAQAFLNYKGDETLVIESVTVYNNFADYAYDQTEEEARNMLGTNFDFATFERQRRAKAKVQAKGDVSNLSTAERLRRTAMAKLSADERAALGIVAVPDGDSNVIVLPSTRRTVAAPSADLQALIDIVNEAEPVEAAENEDEGEYEDENENENADESDEDGLQF